jgi:23S rRNA (cytidine2498-2'-O)-methyltransferase
MELRQSPFVFTVCQTGAEPALKKEIALAHPNLRFAYSRPGFVTFKAIEGSLNEDFALNSVFARAYGLSFGKAGPATIEKLVAFVRDLASEAASRGLKLRLHAWERDQHFPGDEPPGFERGVWTRAMTQALLEAFPESGSLFAAGEPAEGSLVLDLVAVEPEEWWFGCHRHSAVAHAPVPGGRFEIALPPEAPSRAYVKLEEALRWSRLPIRKGDVAVEIGSAPGGASWALLQRGVQVAGIDPGEMDPRVASDPNFLHFKSPVAQVPREMLPDSVEWLLLDMNVEPRISLFAVDRLASRMSDTLLGLVLTVKLNQWSFADQIPSMLEHIRAMGMSRVRATQLSSNRQEILIVGLTRKGMLRSAA